MPGAAVGVYGLVFVLASERAEFEPEWALSLFLCNLVNFSSQFHCFLEQKVMVTYYALDTVF